MSGVNICGVLISRNRKTGRSVNCSRDTCHPTKLCRKICYGHKMTDEELEAAQDLFKQLKVPLEPTRNNGPITWPKQQNRYKKNTEAFHKLGHEGQLGVFGIKLAEMFDETVMRFCGLGDLFPQLCGAIGYAALAGQRIFLFSRKPREIARLTTLCETFGVDEDHWPFVIGSVDDTTTKHSEKQIISAVEAHNGQAALAYTALDITVPERFDNDNLFVVFGYHSNKHKTVVWHKQACPSTNGETITCNECRHCYGPHA